MRMLQVNYHYQDRSKKIILLLIMLIIFYKALKKMLSYLQTAITIHSLWCLQARYGIRTDVRIVNLSLAQTEWYNIQLKNERPYGALTVPFTLSDAQLRKIAPDRWDPKTILSIDVPPKAYPDSMRNKGNAPAKLSWNFQGSPYNAQGQQIQIVKGSDIVMMDILKANKFERPIYSSQLQ